MGGLGKVMHFVAIDDRHLLSEPRGKESGVPATPMSSTSGAHRSRMPASPASSSLAGTRLQTPSTTFTRASGASRLSAATSEGALSWATSKAASQKTMDSESQLGLRIRGGPGEP